MLRAMTILCAILPLVAADVREYRARKAFEARYESERRQVDAIRECAVSKIQACVWPLIENLRQEGTANATLRRESANALGHLQAREARETLLQLLPNEPDVYAKAAYIRALGRIGNKQDIKAIASGLGDSDAFLRRSAARALFEINDPDASAEASAKIASEKDELTRVELLNAALRHQAANVAHIHALTALLLSQDRAVRLRTAEVLAFYANKEALADLERALSVEPDPQVRTVLSQAIIATQWNN
ncbi:MAG: HEAT repeat domain-containing protein [Turneriella sp.]|nr:HEAT repeat domain-containing protein [Turneriella sp.]